MTDVAGTPNKAPQRPASIAAACAITPNSAIGRCLIRL
jgi:hypothetical protein